MLHGCSLMLAALTTLMPDQLPAGPIVSDSIPAGATVVPSPYPPVMISPEYHASQVQTCSSGGCGPAGFCGREWTFAEKCAKLKRFLTYQSVYKTPCCQKRCDIYTPPLYEWFPPCADGFPPMQPCLPPVAHCPSYRHPFLRLLGWSAGPGCASCGQGPH